MEKDCDFDLGSITHNLEKHSVKELDVRIDELRENCIHASAVLVPIVTQQDQISLLFTRRAKTLERHSGQVSFPGGVIEKGDRSVLETALRETQEEIGLEKDNIQIIGQLKPFNTSTGYFVYPVVGVIHSLEKLRRNIVEVDRIFCIPIKWLCGEQHSRLEEIVSPEGITRKVWFYDLYEGELLWGITAKITHDLIEIIKK